MQQRLAVRVLRECAQLGHLAWPLIIAQISQVGMGFTDTVMAGHLGVLDLAAVALGSMLWLPVFLLCFGILNALTPTVAHLFGACRYLEIGRVFRQGLWLAAVLAVLSVPMTIYIAYFMRWMDTIPEVAVLAGDYLFAVSWGMPAMTVFFALRCLSEGVGHTRPVMFINVFGLGLNALANYVFMFGKLGAPALGAVGCGVATMLVMWMDLLMLLVYLIWAPHFSRFALFLRVERPDWPVLANLARLGLPISLSIMTEVWMFLIVSLLMSRFSAVAMAAHQVAINFASLMFMVPLSIGKAITIRVGHGIGESDVHRAKLSAYIGVSMAMAFMCCSALVILSVPHYIAAMYSDEAEVIALAVILLYYAAAFQLSDGLSISLIHALWGLKDTFVPMLFGMLTFWGIGLSTAYTLGIHWQLGPQGLWIGLIVGLSAATLTSMGRLHILFRRLL